MKGTKRSVISLSFVFITENGKLDDKAKKIIFPSNYDSLIKSVNKLYEKKFDVRSIYTSDGILITPKTDLRFTINPGNVLIVSPNEPSPDLKNENEQKTVSLFSESNDTSFQNSLYENKFNQDNNKNEMSKERRQIFNQLFGLTSQTHFQSRKQSQNDVKSINSNMTKGKRNKLSKNNNNNSSNKLNETKNIYNSIDKLKKQRDRSIESFNSINEIQKQTHNYQNNQDDFNTENATDNLDSIENTGNLGNNLYTNTDNTKASNKKGRKSKHNNNNFSDQNNQNQQIINQLPFDLYSNLDNANFDDTSQFSDLTLANQKHQETQNEDCVQESSNNKNNLNEEVSSSLYYGNNSKYNFDATSEAHDGNSCSKNSCYGINDEDESYLCQISTEILNEDSFTKNVKNSIQLLDDEIMSKFLRTGQTLEDNQRSYWYQRYLKYFEEQKIGQHGNYMFAYDSMIKYAKDFISDHRFIIYPISNIARNQKSRNNNNNNNNTDSYPAKINNNNLNNINPGQIHYCIKTKAAICGPRKSGKSTLLSIIAEQLLTEIAINGFWKNSILYFLDVEDCAPFFDDYKALYLFFIEFSLKAIVLQRPVLTPYYLMLIKFFGSIFDFTKAPKLKKTFSSNPLFLKFSINCEDLAMFFSQLWNNQDSHFLFFTNIFQIPSLLASAAGLTNVFLFVDNIEYSHEFVFDDLDQEQEINVYEAFTLLLERVNYIVTCEEQSEMLGALDSKTEIISTFQLNAQTHYDQIQLIVKYKFEQCDEMVNNKKRRPYENELTISQSQQMVLTASYCGGIPAFVSLWDEINSIADEIDELNQKLDNEMGNRIEEEDNMTNNEDEKINQIEEMEEVLISLVQNFVNDMVIDNDQRAKIKVIDVRRSSKQ